MEMEPMINLYLEYGMSKQLRERSLQSYKQTLGLFAAWIRDQGILEIEEIKDATIRKYTMLSIVKLTVSKRNICVLVWIIGLSRNTTKKSESLKIHNWKIGKTKPANAESKILV